MQHIPYKNLSPVQQEMHRVLADTVKWFKKDPSRRAVNMVSSPGSPACCYCTADGRKCAVGRYIPDEKYTPGIEGFAVSKDEVLTRIKTTLILPLRFWRDLQRWHDDIELFNDKSMLRSIKYSIQHYDPQHPGAW